MADLLGARTLIRIAAESICDAEGSTLPEGTSWNRQLDTSAGVLLDRLRALPVGAVIDTSKIRQLASIALSDVRRFDRYTGPTNVKS